MKKTLFTVAITILISSFVIHAQAQPSINSINGSFNHKATITINGSNFGTKSPAAPFRWHDLENHSSNVDDPFFLRTQFVDAWPSHNNCGDWRLMLKNSNSNRWVNPPHNRSSIIAGGGHKDTFNLGNEYCSNVMITFAPPTPKATWYILWYERYSSDFPHGPPPGGTFFNQKAGTIGTGDHGYGGEECQVYGLLPSTPGANADFCPARCSFCGGNNCAGATVVNDITEGWRHLEVRIDRYKGIGMWGADNEFSIDSSCSTGDLPFWGFSPKNYGMGGFLRWYGEGSPYHGCDNAWRYFDDMYVDHTLSRVILANNSNYNNATYIEPQIPSAWSPSSITVTTNLGKLSGTAYLFVFDSNDNHNTQGYPVSLGGGTGTTTTTVTSDFIPPDPPTGLRIVTTTIP